MNALQAALRVPRRWTYEESASLLGFSVSKLKRLIYSGEITGPVETWYIRPPGTTHAYRKQRGYISSDELRRWMKAQETTIAERRRRTRSTRATRSSRASSPEDAHHTVDTTATPERDHDGGRPRPTLSLDASES